MSIAEDGPNKLPNMSLSIIILAAGQGKRMHSDLPKVLQPLAGKPMLGYVIAAAQALVPEAIYVVYGHGGDVVKAAFSSMPLTWVLQAEQLGTGHAVQQVAPLIPDEHQVLILYGDVPLIREATLRRLVGSATEQTLNLLSVDLPDASGYGRVLRDKAGSVYRIVEQKDANRKELAVSEANTGLMVAPARALKRWVAGLSSANAQHEYYLTDIIGMAAKDGFKVEALKAPTATEVLGVNDKVQLASLEAENRLMRARELMLAGATVLDPTRLDVRGAVTVGRDVVIDVNVVFEGTVVLGDRVRIGAGCVLKDSSIASDTVLNPYSVLDSVEVGMHCILGPFARLRPGSRVLNNAHVGNFVELKNTTLGAGSKANHLTYLGDTVVGERVNVGAGTITCNYDGVNKWPTEIHDDAFIGSGSMLVAPVTIGKNAVIGAGSTITKSAAAHALTLTRAKQQTIADWKPPVKASESEKAERIKGSRKNP